MDDIKLHPDHPDFNAKPGDKRTDDMGVEWTFGRNQYSIFWRAGPKDGSVHCSRDFPGYGNPYRADGLGLSDPSFEYAAKVSRRGARREYEKAKRVVDRYEGKE